MEERKSHDEALQRLGELIRGINIAMMTTTADDGSLRSRPMATQETPFDGNLWFFTRDESAKVDEIRDHGQVNLSYADPDHQKYVSVSGHAVLMRDRRKIEELWKPTLKVWFPNGADDPHLSLLRVTVEKAEYWDAPSNRMVLLAGMVTALLKGESFEPGENEKLDMESGARPAALSQR